MTNDETDTRVAEIRKLEAERYKFEQEGKQIERRLNERWWSSDRLAQYAVAIVITSALLFGWTRVYLEPMLRKESEINKLTEQRNAVKNEVVETKNIALDIKNNSLELESKRLGLERDRLQEKADELNRQAEKLKEEQRALSTVIAGLRMAIAQVEKGGTKFFSILNKNDPIMMLESLYGWRISSDNRYGNLGYYLLINHGSVRGGKRVLVGREFDIDRLKSDGNGNSSEYIKKVSEEYPLLMLDYSYLALLVDPNSPVGGTLYRKGREELSFHAPLREWSKALGELLPTE